MATRKRRMPSQREPVGNTKSEIVIYVSNNDGATITDIRAYLRKEKNIRNVKVIRKHLSDLVSENIISIRKAERRGLSDTYHIERSFSQFKTVFNFLNDFYKPLFLRSKYAREQIFSDYFFIYGMVNIGIEVLKDLIQLSDEDKFNELIEKARRNGEDVSVKETRKTIENMKNQLSGYNIVDIEDYLRNARPEDLISNINNLYEVQPIELKPILSNVINSIFPDKQRNEMLQIISSSPMAMDYFLNLRSADRTYLFVTILRYYLGSLFMDPEKASLINLFDENHSTFESDPMFFISRILSIQKVSNDNPLLTILRSFFVVDSFNGNVVDNEYSESVLKEILLPKVNK
ncbi:hypothetical protein ACNF42_07780 [Cuniculiplasma sp. SKW3]|uniref:hypothetical protein n=1 Tax=Cuniculiplasma sp. SKW3 TaxID=3400170 RepID=UPI003FCF774B